MRITPGVVLLAVAVILFIVAAVADVAGIDLVALGLAAFAAAFVLDRLMGDRPIVR